MSQQNQPFRLNDAQMLLLQLFQHRHMSAPELDALRDTLVKHLSAELDDEIEQVMNTKNLTVENIAERTEAINEHRTHYLKKARLPKS